MVGTNSHHPEDRTMTALLLLVPLAAAPADPPAPTPTDEMVARWVADLTNEDSAKQRAAHESLMKAGPKAKSAVPALTKLLGEKNAPVYYAADVLGAIGPDAKAAVPALLERLAKDGSYGATEQIAVALARIDSAKLEATRALLLGQRRCTPNLLVGSQVLHSYPAQVIPHLVALCSDKEPQVRAKAAEFIGTLKERATGGRCPPPSLFERAGPEATKGIAPALEKLLADEDTRVRLEAAQAIVQVAPELTDKALAAIVKLAETAVNTKAGLHAGDVFRPVPEKSAKVLVPLFDHPDDGLRMWAINHVAPLTVREPVEDALKNGKTARVRQAAAIALGARYGSGVASEPALIAALKDNEFAVRFAAGMALVQIGTRERPANFTAAIPVLVEGLQQKDEQVRLLASQYLLMSGSVAKAALPALAKLLDDKAPEVRFEAALAMVGLDKSSAAGTVPALTEGVKTGTDSNATRAAKALAQLGPVAKDAVPELVKKFGAKNAHLRLYAAEAAARIDPAQAPAAVEVLVALLKDKKFKSNMVRAYALTALRHIGPPAKSALPTLTELLKDDEPFHADVALAMLAIGTDEAKPALEWVRKVMADKSHDDLYDLMVRLPELGRAARPLVPELTAMLKSKTPFERKNAIEALGAIGADAKDALPELKALAEKDPRNDVRQLATEAVESITKKAAEM